MNNYDQNKTEELTVYWTQAQPAVAAFISSMVPNFQDSDDILQSVAITIVKKFDQYERDKPFVSWSIGIARKEILKFRRKCAKDPCVLDDELIGRIATTYQKEFSRLDEIKKALNHCIQKVQGRWRQILEMRYIRGMKPTRIAQQLGMSVNAVFISLHRARVTLKKCINRQIASKGI